MVDGLFSDDKQVQIETAIELELSKESPEQGVFKVSENNDEFDQQLMDLLGQSFQLQSKSR